MYESKIKFFDAQARAPWADAPYGEDEEGKLERLLALLPPGRGHDLLEPGCGTGRLTERLAQTVGPKGSVTALDISPRMVESARTRLTGMDNAEVLVADLERCVLPKRAYDAVVCHQVFPHFNDPARALERISKLLKPRGRVIVSHFIGRDEVNDVHRKAGTAVENDLLPDAEGMHAMFETVGFSIAVLEDLPGLYLLSASRA
ncbi:Ubiquinone/menaquinone biosynthesis C-methylase UbiE [Paucidesulfovibrio gracilis DSM 16080]|uniref:Ubiquinone/menaquinone biosynthesis C-methylase UbiE n=1 Tax=Paucidesulfovibrio gracilis DSM 16080 TaxID=1121449 RepID=A0A1T4WYT9_9BACT|nr:class I SAM-dependent methyltransferase [Paucidesulfovibrio gracilis]SKA82015.1 Ubiquinone/menaquinone biosynthesis C-methylase UbiE [Paucidesulfovibrio gracilis DSM 16080]